jgi:hypothetical protein
VTKAITCYTSTLCWHRYLCLHWITFTSPRHVKVSDTHLKMRKVRLDSQRVCPRSHCWWMAESRLEWGSRSVIVQRKNKDRVLPHLVPEPWQIRTAKQPWPRSFSSQGIPEEGLGEKMQLLLPAHATTPQQVPGRPGGKPYQVSGRDWLG